jgi:hypothetical protein
MTPGEHAGRYKNPPFILLLGLGRGGSKGYFPQQSQVSESNAREIRYFAGQRTLPVGQQVKSSRS